VIITIFQSGANYMSSSIGVAKEIASLITGILLLFAACGEFMKALGIRRIEKIEDARIAAMQAERAKAQAGDGSNRADMAGNDVSAGSNSASGSSSSSGSNSSSGSSSFSGSNSSSGSGELSGNHEIHEKRGGNDR
jgi:simple sugar transport system permease protein